MVEENTPESGDEPNEPELNAGEPPTSAPLPAPGAVSAQPDKPKGALTPGQRLAAKKAQKAVDKREAKEDRKRAEEETRQKEQEEADRLLGRGPVEPALPAEVERAASGFTHFMQDNRGRLIGGVVVALGVVFAVVAGRHLMHSGSAKQATQLTRALEVANASIDADDADGKNDDGKPVFKSEQDRATKALVAFDEVAKTGDGITTSWAKLAGGASLVQLGKFDDAEKRFAALSSDKDAELSARALEGAGIALEAAGKLDEASKRYQQLAKLEGSKDLGEYHLARLQLQRGDVEGGKAALKKLYDQLSAPGEGSAPSRYLRSEVEVRLAELDSSLVDKGSSSDGPGGQQQFSEEQIQKMIEQLQRQQQQQGKAPE
jgi:tetratricopeptide (TPR) repeat protein